MLYALKIATRYLMASASQTALLVTGVAVGVFIFIFMSALIGGLAEFIMARTVGDMAHITIDAEPTDPPLLLPRAPGRILLVQQKTDQRSNVLPDAAAFIPTIEAIPGVLVTSQEITGSGFLIRGKLVQQVSVTGVEPGKVSAIVRIGSYIVEGRPDLAAGTVLLGKTLADNMKLAVGQTVRLQASTGIDAALTVAGIFKIGSGGQDRRQAYVSLATARTLFAMPQAISQIEIRLADLYAADATAARIEATTGLHATPWTEQAAQLLAALKAQAQTGLLLKSFALVTIVIGIASAMLLSTFRRRPEIGIMRAMGAKRSFVLLVFIAQGAIVGLLGGVSGAAIGYLVLSRFPGPGALQPGGLPIDLAQGAFGLAILLTTIGAILASILPARSAARVDPATAIGQ